VKSFARQRGTRTLPPSAARTVVIPAPCACPVCGGSWPSSARISRDTEIVRPMEVIQTVREKFPAPLREDHPATAGSMPLPAPVLERAAGDDPMPNSPAPPLNRQVTLCREGVELDVSTLADWVGACSHAGTLVELIRRHVWRRPDPR